MSAEREIESPKHEATVYVHTTHRIIPASDLGPMFEAGANLGVSIRVVASEGEEYTLQPSTTEKISGAPKNEELKVTSIPETTDPQYSTRRQPVCFPCKN